MTRPELAAAAAELARQGLPVFPVAANKHPVTTHGHKDATSDPAAALSLFLRSPGAALIGVPTGTASGIVAIDIDPAGVEWFYARARLGGLPPTRVHKSPRGFHLLYRCPAAPVRNSAGKLARGVDIRGEGGSIICAPSPGYSVIDECDPAPLPRWIVKALEKKPKPKPSAYDGEAAPGAEQALASFVARSRRGERNHRLFWAACRLGEAGLPVAEVIAAARSVGLDDIEIAQTVRSGIATAARERRDDRTRGS